MANKLIKLQGSSYRTLRGSLYLAGYAESSGTTIVDPLAGAVYAITGDVPVTIPAEIHGQDATKAICVRLTDPNSYADPYTSLAHSAVINSAGDVTITPAGGLTEYAVLIASVETTQPSESEQQAGKALGWPLLIGMNAVTTTDTQPTFGGLYNSGDYADLAVTIDGTTYIDSESPAGFTVGSGVWSLDLSAAGQTLTAGEVYRVSIAQVGAGGTSYVTTSTVTVNATVLDLQAYYNAGKILEDSGGPITRDTGGLWYSSGISVQSHIVEGDPVGELRLHDAVSDTIAAGYVRGTPVSAQDTGIGGTGVTLSSTTYAEFVPPDHEKFTIVVHATGRSTGQMLVLRDNTAAGGLFLRWSSATTGALQGTIRDASDAAVATATTPFVGLVDVYACMSVDRAAGALEVFSVRHDVSEIRTASATWSTGDVHGLGQIRHSIGGGKNGATAYTGTGVPLQVWIYDEIVTSSLVNTHFDPGSFDPSAAGNLVLHIDGARLGVELDSSPTDLYPVATGTGAQVTAEDY